MIFHLRSEPGCSHQQQCSPILPLCLSLITLTHCCPVVLDQPLTHHNHWHLHHHIHEPIHSCLYILNALFGINSLYYITEGISSTHFHYPNTKCSLPLSTLLHSCISKTCPGYPSFPDPVSCVRAIQEPGYLINFLSCTS